MATYLVETATEFILKGGILDRTTTHFIQYKARYFHSENNTISMFCRISKTMYKFMHKLSKRKTLDLVYS